VCLPDLVRLSRLLILNDVILPSFDRARLIRQEQYLARNGIDPSGWFPSFSCARWSAF
jgi:hypothetical protein